jgi:hypothetical protein
VNPDEVLGLYQHAFKHHRNGQRLAAERWARAAKHLARACWHEAKIAFLEPRATNIPYLEPGHGPDAGGNAAVPFSGADASR